ncbi:LPS O-antigen chain length determinant protein WzzB [Vibrio genomosp. F10]|uniref:LPS O-antigen chain length determinant protein WzzB n=1 Tax=Vibrio genomosp. F10 TaxID=723171 RepID=UPI00084C0BB3|nr:Wzz/FepE/Etk N-terminal domain-containing protein [Vibrio genomosp. F10]OEF01127.1 chain-length determining protein [Vibrio genomosp. F10 str. 9ZD137]
MPSQASDKQYTPHQELSFSTPVFHQPNDEIDLKELFLVIWKGKWTIIATTVLFSIVAVAYALNAQQWWSSKAQIMPPQLQDISGLSQQIQQFQPVFDIAQGDGTLLKSEELSDFASPGKLFGHFIQEFNSTNNKRDFLDSSQDFQQFKVQLEAEAEAEAEAETTLWLYAAWFQKISASIVDKNDENSPYELSFQATEKASSYSLINEYIDFISQKLHRDVINNLTAIISTKKQELFQQKTMLELQAKKQLEIEIFRAEYALEIAKAANVTKPIQINDGQQLFNIDMGSLAIEAKIAALKSIENLDVIAPRLQPINSKLMMLENLTVDNKVEFASFRFIGDVEKPLTRDKPKRALIAVLGTLLGGILGVAIVLARFVFRKEEDA